MRGKTPIKYFDFNSFICSLNEIDRFNQNLPQIAHRICTPNAKVKIRKEEVKQKTPNFSNSSTKDP